MAIEFPRISSRRQGPQQRILVLIGVIIVVLFFSRSVSGLVLDYAWWGELGQVNTWIRMSAYQFLPGLASWIILFAVLWIAHARGMKYAGTRLRDHPIY